MRSNLSDVLILSCLMLFSLYLSSLLGFLGVLLASACIVILLSGFFQYMSDPSHSVHKIQITKNKKDLLAVALLLAPTNIMLGTLVGILQGMPSMALSLVMIVIFSFICSLAYVGIMHTICFLILENKSFSESLLLSSKNISERKKDFAYLSLAISTSCILGFVSYGLLLVVAIPMIFLTGFYSFDEMIKKRN